MNAELIGAPIAPDITVPHQASIASGEFSIRVATRSPGRTPSSARPAAKRPAWVGDVGGGERGAAHVEVRTVGIRLEPRRAGDPAASAAPRRSRRQPLTAFPSRRRARRRDLRSRSILTRAWIRRRSHGWSGITAASARLARELEDRLPRLPASHRDPDEHRDDLVVERRWVDDRGRRACGGTGALRADARRTPLVLEQRATRGSRRRSASRSSLNAAADRALAHERVRVTRLDRR